MSAQARLLVAVVAILTVGFILRLVRRRQLRAKYSILWVCVGLTLVALAAWPKLLDRVSISLGISYGPATLFLFAITLLLLVVIHFSWELSRLEERTRTLAEEVAFLRLQGELRGSGDAVPCAGAPAPRAAPSAAWVDDVVADRKAGRDEA